MPINPNIALGVQPIQVPNQLANYAQFAQIQNAQQANQLNALKMEEYARARQEEEDIRNYLTVGGADISSPETRLGLMKFGKTGLEYGKALTEQDKLRADLMEKRTKIAGEKMSMFRDALGDVNTPEQAAAWVAAQHQDPDIKPIISGMRPLDQSIASIPTERKAFEDWKAKNALGMTKFIERNTMTASEKAHVGVAQGNLKVAQDRLAAEQSPNVVQRQTVDDSGKVTNYNKFGEIINTVSGAGKQSATFAKTEAQKKTMAKDLDLAIGELANVTKDGGLIDQSTGSYIGKAVDIGARAFGKATPGDVAAGKLAPIADLALKMVPRFEGPQSNADTVSYKQAAGQLADSTLPAEIRKAAGAEVLRLMKARRNQFVTPDMASGNTATPSVAPPAGFVPD